MKKALITALATTLQITCAIAGVPLRFDADVRSTSTFQASAYRGETLDIRARLLDGAHPLPVPAGAEAAMLWQTNGMGSAWWTAPATVSTSGVVEATWTPTNDVGAASYRVFLGVAADGRNWRANLLLRLIDAPGASPNELAPPVQSIDFSLVEVSNAPWVETESDPTVPAWAKAETPPLTEESDPVWEAEKGGYATTNDATYTVNGMRIAHNALLFTNGQGVVVEPMVRSSIGHGVIGLAGIRIGLSEEFLGELDEALYGLLQSQAEAAVAATNYTDAAVAAIDIPDPDLSFTNDYARAEGLANLKNEIEAGWWSEWKVERTYNGTTADVTAQVAQPEYDNDDRQAWSVLTIPGELTSSGWVVEDADAERLEWDSETLQGEPVRYAATRWRVAAPVPTKAEDIGAQPAGDYATPSEVSGEISAASNALARAWSADSVLLSSMLLGSNVVAEVTNYNSQVRSPTLRLLQLNESNEYFQVWAETNNLSRVALAATNHADTVSAAAYNAATNYAAPRAWSGTTSGLGADAPEGWTWISTPQMAIAGGLEYEKNITSGGAIWILKSNGMAADFHSVSNNTAYLDISATDGSSLFRIEKTDSFLVGVDTTSVNVSGDALICGVNCVSATHPLVRVRQSLTQGDWSREEDGIPANLATVEWSGESGAWVCEITNTSGGHSMFAAMEMLQEGGAKLVNAASLDVSSSGILCTDGVHKVRPVYNNGAITWEVFQ